jgi:hypothetical protein
MKITQTQIGFDRDGEHLPDVLLAEDAHEIIIEHMGLKIILRTLSGFERVVIVSPEEPIGGTVRRLYFEPIGGGLLLQQWVSSRSEAA